MQRKTNSSVSKNILARLGGDTHAERVLHRLHCVVLVLSGLSAKDVALFYGDSPRAVAYWVEKFQVGGEKALSEKERAGRPTQLTDDQMEKASNYVVAAKQRNIRVNGKSLAEYIKSSFDVSLTERHCWRLLKAMVQH